MSDWSLSCPDVEYLWVKLSLPDIHLTYVCSVHHSPSGSVPNFLSFMEQKLIHIYSEGLADILMIGDVNIDVNRKRDGNVKKYQSFVKTNKLTQYPSNYHPILILPCLGKMLERLAHTQLYHYIVA